MSNYFIVIDVNGPHRWQATSEDEAVEIHEETFDTDALECFLLTRENVEDAEFLNPNSRAKLLSFINGEVE